MTEDDSIWRGGHRQHEGVAAADCASHHQIDWVDAQRQRHLAAEQRITNYPLTPGYTKYYFLNIYFTCMRIGTRILENKYLYLKNFLFLPA
jgi:hypothetical protein